MTRVYGVTGLTLVCSRAVLRDALEAFRLTAITLSIDVEAYALLALGVATAPTSAGGHAGA
jgi:hypothetical protein